MNPAPPDPTRTTHPDTRSLADFAGADEGDLITRYGPLADWVDRNAARGLFQFIRSHETRPGRTTSVVDFGGNRHGGINLSSQDYLGLAADTRVTAAAVRACLQFGPHSAGSEPMGDGFSSADLLQAELEEVLGNRRVVLFPTGWAAGYGSLAGIVRPDDTILIDGLAHD
ncbi:MAG: hypothetical protein RLN75_02850, partial [Longimicrobiales bacterium]